MNTEKTAAEKFGEIAVWLKKQNKEFTKNFKSMNSIIRVYKVLPADYDKNKSLLAHIKKNGTTWSNNRLKLILNSEFGIRYFADAPHRYTFRFTLRRWGRVGYEHTEVRCVVTDHCSLWRNNLYESQEFGAATIEIKDLGDARRAADRLLAGAIQSHGNDYESGYGDILRKAMKNSNPTAEKLTEQYEIPV